ncbi:hypothetical protein [Tepidiforma thermophila]|uniref:Uncharacterized protein n=1 Tax=Tepidiforma thermophila (strain KCTC 52669 / CGMCC 1.13589 / G233) TaxID=2761530 RepID=A0A2A9HF53_TEPT2|nr:hypothetical protein [Tepidiforma thermophila]PFG73616.1 hypothetical protein A9A59_0818 [Tepidiforma thermophila]
MPQSVIPGPLAGRLAPIPSLRDGFERFLAACFDTDAVPAATLERCRRLVAALHRADPADCGPALAELPSTETDALARGEAPFGLPRADALALDIARYIPWSHHDLPDAPVLAFRDECGDRAAVTLLAALAMFDAVCRMTLVAPRLEGA